MLKTQLRLLLILTLLPLTSFALNAPVVTITCEQTGDSVDVTLNWDLIPGATLYYIYSHATDPYGEYELGDCIDLPPYEGRTVERQFFHVIAGSPTLPPAGFTFVPAGTFMMGDDEDGVYYTSPAHQITLTRDFYLSTCHVTNQDYMEAVQWAYDNGFVTATEVSVLGETTGELLDLDAEACEITFSAGVFGLRESPSTYAQGAYPTGYDPADHPVKEVSWFGAACYCDWISIQDDLEPYYVDNWDQSITHDPYTSPGYRLPTEAEWEYAASYADERLYPWGAEVPDCSYAYFSPDGYCVG
jgi:hypothetical protein